MGCARPDKPSAKRHRVAKVNSFTEATPVYRVVSAPPYAFAATAAGLDQWDLRSGRRIDDTRMFTTRIADLAYDASRKALWIVGVDGLARYDLSTKAVAKFPVPPGLDPAQTLSSAVLTPSPDGGIYLGVATSLYYANLAGGWTEAQLGSPVSALHVADSDVYVGTESGVFALRGTDAIKLECDMAAVRQLVQAPGGGVLAIGVADAGAERVALIEDGGCQSFRPSPELRWIDVAASSSPQSDSDAQRVIVLTRSRVYELTAAKETSDIRRLSRRGMTLLPTSGAISNSAATVRRSRLLLRPLSATVPPGAQTVAVSGGELLVGTRSLGTARLPLERNGDDGDSRWLRRQELADRASILTVSCELESDCRLANGSGERWRFDGERFLRRGDDGVLGMLEIGGLVLSVRRASETSVELVPSPSTGELADRVALASVRVPEGFELRRLRRGVGRSVVLGWAARGSDRNASMALVHHVSLASGLSRTVGAAGAPIRDVVACGGRIYAALASETRLPGVDAGAADDVAVKGQGADADADAESGPAIVDLTEGAPVRIVQRSAARLFCDRDQLVAATDTAISRLEGAPEQGLSSWKDIVSLERPVRDVVVAPDGRVYIADDKGLGLWDGNRVRRYDVRRGLLENDLLEIALDRFGRLWIRGASSVGLFRL